MSLWYSHILDAFKVPGHRRCASHWSVCCPAHDDDFPSLSIWLGRNGDRLLIGCWAGCKKEDVLHQAGLSMRDLFRPKTDANGDAVPFRAKVIEATYDYLDESGELLYQTCFSPDTEVLTSTGWVPFPQLHDLHLVAQYHAGDGEVSFSLPLSIQTVPYSGSLVQLEATWCDLLVTPDHRMLGRTNKGFEHVYRAADLPKGISIPVAGRYPGDRDGPTPAQARLLAAYQADGHKVVVGRQLRWHLLRERKIVRLRQLLADVGLDFNECKCPSDPALFITIDRHAAPWIERWMPAKELDWGLLSWPIESRVALIEESGHWDGGLNDDHPNCICYSSAKQINVDVMAAAGALSGYGSTTKESRTPKDHRIFTMTINRTAWRSLTKKWMSDYSGYVHCCTVPSGFIIVRRNGRVVVTGNCRYDPKDFRQRRPCPATGGWLWDLCGVRLVLYRTPEIARHTSAVIYLAEGEKCADALHAAGLLATTGAGGCGMGWRDEYALQLAGRRVVLLPDNDAPGRQLMTKAAGSLLVHGAASVRWVDLPGRAEHAGADDFLKANGKDALLACVRACPEWRAS